MGNGYFECPYCKCLAEHIKYNSLIQSRDPALPRTFKCENDACGKYFIKLGDSYIYPMFTGPEPHQDMTEDCKSTFEQARMIASISPKASAAMLRLCIDMLCDHVQVETKNKKLNEKIQKLLDNGKINLSQANILDAVRVIGNGALHPGLIDYSDQTSVNVLFLIINDLVDGLLGTVNRIETIKNMLSPEDRDKLDNRIAKP